MQITAKEYQAFANYEAKGYVMKNMPTGDISTVKYFVPMYDGGIEGYYEITAIKFGSRKEVLKSPEGIPYADSQGNELKIDKPCLNLTLGSYHSLGDHIVPIGMFPKWNGQIHTHADVSNLYEGIPKV